MEQKINLDKFLGDLREELYNRNMWLLIEVIDAALKQQHIGIYDGIAVDEGEQKPTKTNSLEEFPKEGQRWYICTKDVWDKCYGTPAFLKGEYATFDNILSKCSNTKRLFSEIFPEHFRRATEDDLQKKKQNSIKFEEKPDTNNQAEKASTTPENQEEEFLYHTPSASLWPYREEHYMLVDRDCARLLKLLRKILSSLPEHEVLPRLSYFQGVFEGSAMRRQQKIEKQMRTDI